MEVHDCINSSYDIHGQTSFQVYINVYEHIKYCIILCIHAGK